MGSLEADDERLRKKNLESNHFKQSYAWKELHQKASQVQEDAEYLIEVVVEDEEGRLANTTLIMKKEIKCCNQQEVEEGGFQRNVRYTKYNVQYFNCKNMALYFRV